MESRRSLGTSGIPTPFSVGIGYLIIPYGVDREQFVKTCLQTNTICLRTEGGDFFKNVPVPVGCMSDIVFPQDKSVSDGSVVAYVMMPKHNAPIVFGVLPFKDDLGLLTKENQYKIVKKQNDDSVSIELKAEEGQSILSCNISGKNSKLTINVSSDDDSSVMEINTKGNLSILSSKSVSVQAQDDCALVIVDKNTNSLSHIRYNSGGWEIKSDSNGNAQPIVLGNQILNKLEDLFDLVSDTLQQISILTVPVTAPGSPSGPPTNSALFLQYKVKLLLLKQQLNDVLSKKNKTD